tara:strand:- start:9219 stop:10052 length:834 start_codon:yes stop_codon:yes gene_type:complete
MSSLKVLNIYDVSGTCGLIRNGSNWEINRTDGGDEKLTVNTLQIDGSVTGNASSRFLPSQSGNSGKVLKSNGSTGYWETFLGPQGNLTSMQVFTSGGTWSRPSDVRYVHVQVVGGGGGGGGHGEGGGAGGYSEEIINVESVSTVSVSVSGEAGGTYYRGGAGNGGSSSFGSYLSASGGYGANRNHQHNGGLGGVGSGGNLNIYGGGGDQHHDGGSSNANSGRSFWGGCVAGGHPQGGNFSHNHQSHSPPGSGGNGGYFNSHRGSNGRPGLVVITHYK